MSARAESLQDVARKGAAQIAAATAGLRPGAGPVDLGLEVRDLGDGRAELVRRETGERVGVCCSAAVAHGTAGFFDGGAR